MRKTSIYITLILFLNISFSNTDPKILDKKQTQQLFDYMIKDIELYDSEIIATRNKNKEVSWDEFKEVHRKKWKTKVTASDLKQLFYSFNMGLLNAHIYFEFLYPEEKKNITVSNTAETGLDYSNIKMGYTYPKITFFDTATGNQITHINDEPINEIFWNFHNYEVRAIGKNVTLKYFKLYFDHNYLRIKEKKPNSVTFINNKKIPVIYKKTTPSNTKNDTDQYKNWTLINKGDKTTLFQKDSIALIKIKDFIYPNEIGYNCNDSENIEGTMCKDALLTKKGLDSIAQSTKYLIFDLQNNGGGQENTNFLKMFSPAPFYDMRVLYKKTKLLEDKRIRDALNYYNYQGENWFNELLENGVYQKTEYGAFLPPRSDFCSASTNCKLVAQEPNDILTSKFEKIMLLVNGLTASTADDFVYKFKENDNVYITGQPQSADLTYTMLTMLYYIDENGKIQRKFSGNADDILEVNGTKLFKFNVPYSRTVDKDGNMLQGNPMPLDLLVPITKENFDHIEKTVLEEAVDFLNKKSSK